MSSAGFGFDSRAQRRAIPLTVVGGFLGSGKTTLLNAVLAQAEGRRVAILVNDFGMLSIDAALISARSATTISLSNGCVCCTLISGLAQALIDILQLDPAPDHIVVEASGVGDPGRIAQIARADRSFAQDATIVVAAADQVEMLAADRYVGDTVQKQLASADLIVLNKRDLVSDLQAEAILSWLRSVSPGTRIVEAVNGKLPCDVVLGPAQLSAATYARAAAAPYRMVAGEATDHGHRFSTRTFRCAQPLSEAAMRCALGALPHAVLRAKGFVRFDAAPEIPQLIQVVGRRWSISAAPAVTRAAASVLVIIGAAEALAAADLTMLDQACSGSAISR